MTTEITSSVEASRCHSSLGDKPVLIKHSEEALHEGTPNSTHNEMIFYRIKAFVKKKKSEAGFQKKQSGMFIARLLASSADKR